MLGLCGAMGEAEGIQGGMSLIPQTHGLVGRKTRWPINRTVVWRVDWSGQCRPAMVRNASSQAVPQSC